MFQFILKAITIFLVTEIVASLTITEKLFTQQLDHFDGSNLRTFSQVIYKNFLKSLFKNFFFSLQRYYYNDEYFKVYTPIFLYLAPSGLDDEIINNLFTNSILADAVEEHGGALVAIETRYYGESQPTDDLSLKNLKYLSLDNILFDFNHILYEDFISVTPFKFNIIVVGEEIGATYGTFLRATFNDTIRSGILLGATLDIRTNFGEFYSDINDNFKKYASNECFSIIHNGLDELMILLFNYDSDEIREIFNLDESFDSRNKKDIAILFDDFVGNYLAQLIADGSVAHFKEFCSSIVEVKGRGQFTNNLEILVKNFVPSRTFNYAKLVEDLQNENIGFLQHKRLRPLSSRQSFYQSCSELNWFRTTSGASHPINVLIPIEFYFELCSDVFGSEFTPDFIKKQHDSAIGSYGGSTPVTVANNLFIYGELNPFRLIGIGPFDDYSARDFKYLDYGNTRALDSLDEEEDSLEIRSLKYYITEHVRQFYY